MLGQTARQACCLFSLLLGAAVSAQVEAPAGGPPIDLAEALTRTIARNPDLIAFGFQIEAAEGRLQQATLAPNPDLDIAVQDALGTDARRGVRSAETTVTLGWVLERGVRQRLVDTARAGVALSTFDAEVVRIDLAAETARRFLMCLAFQGRLDNAIRGVALAQEAVDLIAERVGAGGAPEAELARAEADLVRAKLLLEYNDYELSTAYHRLAAQWGETDPAFSSVTGTVSTLPVLEPFEILLSRVEENPELLRFMSRQRLDEAEVALAQARSRPSWQVSGGLRRYEATDDVALVGGLTIPLPIRDRNQGAIAEARASAARTRAELAATQVRIATAIFGLYQELNYNLQLAGQLTVEVSPRLERALQDTRRAYELGRYGYSEWRIVQSEVLDARNALLEARINAHRILIEIERLTGLRVLAPTAVQ